MYREFQLTFPKEIHLNRLFPTIESLFQREPPAISRVGKESRLI